MSEKRILSAADILAANDLTTGMIEVDIPALGGTVYFRPMSALELLDFRANNRNQEDGWVKIFIRCACDGDGKRLFENKDLAAVKAKSAKIFFDLQDKLLHLNGMGPAEKNWPSLRALLEESGVPPAVVKLVESKWDTPESEAKND